MHRWCAGAWRHVVETDLSGLALICYVLVYNSDCELLVRQQQENTHFFRQADDSVHKLENLVFLLMGGRRVHMR